MLANRIAEKDRSYYKKVRIFKKSFNARHALAVEQYKQACEARYLYELERRFKQFDEIKEKIIAKSKRRWGGKELSQEEAERETITYLLNGLNFSDKFSGVKEFFRTVRGGKGIRQRSAIVREIHNEYEMQEKGRFFIKRIAHLPSTILRKRRRKTSIKWNARKHLKQLQKQLEGKSREEIEKYIKDGVKLSAKEFKIINLLTIDKTKSINQKYWEKSLGNGLKLVKESPLEGSNYEKTRNKLTKLAKDWLEMQKCLISEDSFLPENIQNSCLLDEKEFSKAKMGAFFVFIQQLKTQKQGIRKKVKSFIDKSYTYQENLEAILFGIKHGNPEKKLTEEEIVFLQNLGLNVEKDIKLHPKALMNVKINSAVFRKYWLEKIMGEIKGGEEIQETVTNNESEEKEEKEVEKQPEAQPEAPKNEEEVTAEDSDKRREESSQQSDLIEKFHEKVREFEAYYNAVKGNIKNQKVWEDCYISILKLEQQISENSANLNIDMSEIIKKIGENIEALKKIKSRSESKTREV